MDTYIEMLKKNRLFWNLPDQDFKALLEPDACILGHYEKNTLIVHENEPCRSVGFTMEGTLSFQQIAVSGEMIKIETFQPGECFGFALIFSSKPFYPYTLITSTAATVLYIPIEKIKALIETSPAFCLNLGTLLSNRIRLFQDKVRILSQRDVRSRLILYLSGVASDKKAVSFILPNSKTEISDLIGVARPSVSRELKRMQEDGLIVLTRSHISITNQRSFHIDFK